MSNNRTEMIQYLLNNLDDVSLESLIKALSSINITRKDQETQTTASPQDLLQLPDDTNPNRSPFSSLSSVSHISDDSYGIVDG